MVVLNQLSINSATKLLLCTDKGMSITELKSFVMRRDQNAIPRIDEIFQQPNENNSTSFLFELFLYNLLDDKS